MDEDDVKRERRRNRLDPARSNDGDSIFEIVDKCNAPYFCLSHALILSQRDISASVAMTSMTSVDVKALRSSLWMAVAQASTKRRGLAVRCTLRDRRSKAANWRWKSGAEGAEASPCGNCDATARRTCSAKSLTRVKRT